MCENTAKSVIPPCEQTGEGPYRDIGQYVMALYIYMQLTHNLLADFYQVISDAAGSLESLSRVVKAFHKSLCNKNNTLSFSKVERWIECVRVRIDTLIYLKNLICSAARMRSTLPYGCVARCP